MIELQQQIQEKKNYTYNQKQVYGPYMTNFSLKKKIMHATDEMKSEGRKYYIA